jgi:hypothetical protein
VATATPEAIRTLAAQVLSEEQYILMVHAPD